jgi:hypothetical protein
MYGVLVYILKGKITGDMMKGLTAEKAAEVKKKTAFMHYCK